MTDPRPFHIGSEVKHHGFRDRKFIVKASDGHQLVLMEHTTHGLKWLVHTKTFFRHASDGAPLGEWVPISEEMWEASAMGGIWDAPDRDKLNALIRGNDNV